MANEIDFFKKRIREDREKVRELQFKEQNDEVARLLRTAYQSYRDAGFTDEQSFWMIAQMVKKAFKNS